MLVDAKTEKQPNTHGVWKDGCDKIKATWRLCAKMPHRDMKETGRSGLAGGRVAKALSEECRTAASCESTDEKPLMLTTERRLER